MQNFMSDQQVVDRILDHIANKTTDRSDIVWQEPVENYRSTDRFEKELALLRSVPTPFCPSIALSKPGDYIARRAGMTPLIVVRGQDGKIRGFKNACRHRGTELVAGKGCVGAFVCPYHGWSYGLDGALLGIPHADGFPDFDTLENGLAEVTLLEKNGIIFVIQTDPKHISAQAMKAAQEMLIGVPDLLKEDQIIFNVSETVIEANWKIHLESFIEGYHIKPAHKTTFFPFGYDNLNVIEFCGPHSRVTFPFRRIEQLGQAVDQPVDISGKLTYVYHLFPNVILAELSHHRSLGIIEPMGVNQCKVTTYNLTKSTDNPDREAVLETAKRDLDFVNETGQKEDIAMVTAIQRSLNSAANEHFTFGHFEPALAKFHARLAEHIDPLET